MNQSIAPVDRARDRQAVRESVKRMIAMAVAAFTLATGALVVYAAVEEPAAVEAAERSVDFSRYCREKHGGTAHHAWVGSWTAVTWKCTTTGYFVRCSGLASFARIVPRTPRIYGKYKCEATRGFDVNAVCRWQYGSRSYAHLKGQSWSDWRCIT